MDISRIAFEKLNNTRDLGQFSSADGRRIRPRRLIRSGNLHDLCLEDRAILKNDYQLKTVIDFRTEIERSGEPDTKIGGVDYCWIPILDESALGITQEEDGLRQLSAFLLDPTVDAKQYMISIYRKLITSDACRSQYRKFFGVLLNSEINGSILWHCSAGKDRVGVGTALLLSALGVPRDVILDDYLATNTFCTEKLNQMIAMLTAQLGSKDIIPQIDTLFCASASYLAAVWEEIDAQFGGMDSFLEQEMDLSPARCSALQEVFLM